MFRIRLFLLAGILTASPSVGAQSTVLPEP
jgi:hypothetical protein